MKRFVLRGLGLAIIIVAAGSGTVASAECTREHHGELLLTGDQSVVISGGVFCQHGSITLRGNAKLVISDTTLRIDGFQQTVWAKWVQINVHDNAQLILRNVRVETPGSGDGGGLWIHALGTSQVDLNGVQPAGPGGVWATAGGNATVRVTGSALQEVRVAQSASVSLATSSVGWAVNLQFGGAARVTLDSLRPGYHEAWNIPESRGVPLRLAIENTSVGAWSVEVFEHADVSVRNSTVARVILGLAQMPEVMTLVEGYHQSWALHPVTRMGYPGNLTLDNTTVGHWNVVISEHRGSLELRDSHVGGVQTWRSSIRVTMRNVVLRALTAADEHLTLDCSSVIVQQGVELDAARLDISGAISFSTSSTVVWRNSRVVREYTILIIRGGSGEPVAGARVSLEDPSGAIMTYTADHEGVVKFSIAFDDSNYSQRWHLVAGDGVDSIRVPITLLTATPFRLHVR